MRNAANNADTNDPLMAFTTRCAQCGHRCSCSWRFAQRARPPPPRRARASYSESTGYQFYKLASAAYCGDAALANWSCAPCVASNLTASELQIFHDRKTDARGFVAMLDGSVVLSFEGTETLTNWLDDLKFAKTDRNMSCAGCKVHSGFYDCWKGLDAPMVEHVRALREAHPAAPVYVTGHSLGAAIAVIAAYILQYDLGVPIAGVYTYGGPRVGNRAFASYYLFAVRDARDVAPHPPPRPGAAPAARGHGVRARGERGVLPADVRARLRRLHRVRRQRRGRELRRPVPHDRGGLFDPRPPPLL